MLTSLTLFASKAWAMAPNSGEGEGGGSGGLGMFLPLALMGFVLYFFMIRPQSKKQKEFRNMVSSIQKGDKVLTRGGILGVVTGIKDNEFTVEIAPQIRVKVNRSYIDNIGLSGASSNSDNTATIASNKKEDTSAKPDYKV